MIKKRICGGYEPLEAPDGFKIISQSKFFWDLDWKEPNHRKGIKKREEEEKELSSLSYNENWAYCYHTQDSQYLKPRRIIACGRYRCWRWDSCGGCGWRGIKITNCVWYRSIPLLTAEMIPTALLRENFPKFLVPRYSGRLSIPSSLLKSLLGTVGRWSVSNQNW